MSVLVVGLSYKGAPLDLLERLSFVPSDLPKALHAARASEHVREAVILSTCNRVEVYGVVEGFHSGVHALSSFLADFHHAPFEAFAERLACRYEGEAVSHLFGVASGIDSMVVGEPQILQQVRRAFRLAAEEGAVGPVLSALFRHAIRVGRRARTETAIARSASALALAGATAARAELGSLSGRTVLVVGAGKMSDLSVAALASEGAHMLVANRTADRARARAARVGGETVAMADLAGALERADLVLTSTGSHEPVVTRDAVAGAMRARAGRPMVILDLAVPRDVEPSAGEIPGVSLRDLEALRETVAPSAEQLLEVDRVRALVAAETPRFLAWQRAHVLAPMLAALQDRAERVRERELERAASLLAGLGGAERDAVETLTRSIVSKLLHDPVAAVKRLAGTPEGEALARALRALFDLEEA